MDALCAVLTRERHFAFVRGVLAHAVIVEKLDDLPHNGGDCLIGFGTGVIVPGTVLETFHRRYNFHGASPQFPGRDPHHWAAYQRVDRFGATAHVMNEHVDSGPIVGALWRDVGPDRSPAAYRKLAEQCMDELFSDLAPKMAKYALLESDIVWAGMLRSRADLIRICDMRNATGHERDRRRQAFAGFEHLFKTDPTTP
jgi:methionyl-tRNA formyltransferase